MLNSVLLPLLLIGATSPIAAEESASASNSSSSLPPLLLFAPQNGSNLPFNDTITMGFGAPRDLDSDSDDGPEKIPGLSQLIRITATYPDMTEKLLYPSLAGPEGISCGAVVSPGVFPFLKTDQVGNYTVQWEVTYGLSADPSRAGSQGNECGPPPYTIETFTANRTYQVLDPQQTTVSKPAITTFTTISSGSILTSLPAPTPINRDPNISNNGAEGKNGIMENITGMRGLAGVFCAWFFMMTIF